MNTNEDYAYWVYSFAPHQRGGDLAKIGAAVPHPDGNGFNVMLDALPLSANLIVRKPAARQRQKGQQLSLTAQVDSFERAIIEQCLLEACGVIGAVMERLNIPRRTLNEKMARYGIDRRSLLELGKPKLKSKSGGRLAKRIERTPDDAETRLRSRRGPRPRSAFSGARGCM